MPVDMQVPLDPLSSLSLRSHAPVVRLYGVVGSDALSESRSVHGDISPYQGQRTTVLLAVVPQAQAKIAPRGENLQVTGGVVYSP